MYPLIDRSLALRDIARHWQRHFPERPPWEELLDTLVQAVWSGELLGCRSDGAPIDRKHLLQFIGRPPSHPGIVIYRKADDLAPEKEEYADGSVSVFLGKRVYLPLDESQWTEKVITDAYATLCTCKVDDYSTLLLPSLRTLRVTREAFEAFCIGRGYERPGFWFARAETPRDKRKSFGGRPTVMRQIEAELRRHAAAGTLAPALRQEAKALRAWAETSIDPKQQIPGVASIENALRAQYHQLRERHIHKT
jgi:hypothetical protein